MVCGVVDTEKFSIMINVVEEKDVVGRVEAVLEVVGGVMDTEGFSIPVGLMKEVVGWVVDA